MKQALKAFILITGILCSIKAEAVPTMAFGYLANSTTEKNYDYLESLFPNSFANSIKNIFSVNVLRPNEVDEILKNNDSALKKSYEPYEAQELFTTVKADYFVYGKFTPMTDNRIKITMSVIANGHNTMFSFTNTGLMETELFKLVDRITMVMTDFFGDENLFRSEVISPGSKLGILTNIDGPELNELYYTFLSKGYHLASIQGNFVKNYMDDNEIEKFKYISSKENLFDIYSDKRTFVFKYGTWAGDPYVEKLSYLRNTLKIYDFDYNSVKDDLLYKLANRFSGLDNILIIGFDSDRTSAWVRCINVKGKDLVWMQSGITGNTGEIAVKIIERMSSKLQTAK